MAKKFVLVDDDGNPTAYITNAETGFTGFTVRPLSGEDGPMVSIGIGPESGRPIIMMSRPDDSRVLITLLDNGDAMVGMEAADGATRTITTKSV